MVSPFFLALFQCFPRFFGGEQKQKSVHPFRQLKHGEALAKSLKSTVEPYIQPPTISTFP
jgi:hypothetical protein